MGSRAGISAHTPHSNVVRKEPGTWLSIDQVRLSHGELCTNVTNKLPEADMATNMARAVEEVFPCVGQVTDRFHMANWSIIRCDRLDRLSQHEQGMKIHEISREYGINDPTLYNLKAKYGGLSVSEVARIKELEKDNLRLKRMYADLSLVHHTLKSSVGEKISKTCPETGDSYVHGSNA